MTLLCELAHKYGTDKCPTRGTFGHSYTPFYYELFKDRRESVKKVLELGTGVPKTMKIEGYQIGAGLRMWRDFFPNAQVYGADILPDSQFTDDRIQSFLCDLSKKENLLWLIEQTGTDIDILVDDASHKPDHVIMAVNTLMPILQKDVVYIIEDIKWFQPIRLALRNQYDLFVPTFPNPSSRADRLCIVRRK